MLFVDLSRNGITSCLYGTAGESLYKPRDKGNNQEDVIVVNPRCERNQDHWNWHREHTYLNYWSWLRLLKHVTDEGRAKNDSNWIKTKDPPKQIKWHSFPLKFKWKDRCYQAISRVACRGYKNHRQKWSVNPELLFLFRGIDWNCQLSGEICHFLDIQHFY